jgi:hypothetical protein
MRRRLVSCGPVNPDTMKVTASDGTVWLHHVERDEQGNPIPGQINRWLNLLWAPPGMDTLLRDGGTNKELFAVPGNQG